MKPWQWWSMAAVAGGLTMVGLYLASPPPRPRSDSQETGSVRSQEKEGAEALMKAQDVGQIRQVMHRFDGRTSKKEAADFLQTAVREQHDFLKKEISLNEEELDEVQSYQFSGMDAHYLDSCLLLREAARNLEASNLPPLQLAHNALGWVSRQVAPGVAQGPFWLGAADPTWVPSHIVLRRGFGSPHDRALLFLTLLRQLRIEGRQARIEGCVLSTSHPLVGVLLPGSEPEELYLFDPGLGMPVPADDKGNGVATLAMVRERPALLRAVGVAPEEFAKCDVVLNCPLSGLAPRLKLLEKTLDANLRNDCPALYFDGAGVRRKIAQLLHKGTKEKVEVRFSSPGPHAFDPLRMLHRFLPPHQGGRKPAGKSPQESATDGRNRQYQMEQASSPSIFELNRQIGPAQIRANFSTLKLDDNRFLNDDAKTILMLLVNQVMIKYANAPREMLLRGDFQNLTKQLKKVEPALEYFALLDEASFLHGDLVEWRRQAQAAKLSKNRNALNAFLLQDKFFFESLMETESRQFQGDINNFILYLQSGAEVEAAVDGLSKDPRTLEPAEPAEQRPGPKSAEKKLPDKMLTYIIMAACKGALDHQVAYLRAAAKQEQAETRQAEVQRGQVSAKSHAQSEWGNTEGLWYAFLNQQHQESPAQVKKVLLDFCGFRSPAGARKMFDDITRLEAVQRNWSCHCHARLNRARAHEFRGQKKDAAAVRKWLDDLAGEVRSLSEDAELQKALADYLDRTSSNRDPIVANQRRFVAEFQEARLKNLLLMIELRQKQLGR